MRERPSAKAQQASDRFREVSRVGRGGFMLGQGCYKQVQDSVKEQRSSIRQIGMRARRGRRKDNEDKGKEGSTIPKRVALPREGSQDTRVQVLGCSARCRKRRIGQGFKERLAPREKRVVEARNLVLGVRRCLRLGLQRLVRVALGLEVFLGLALSVLGLARVSLINLGFKNLKQGLDGKRREPVPCPWEWSQSMISLCQRSPRVAQVMKGLVQSPRRFPRIYASHEKANVIFKEGCLLEVPQDMKGPVKSSKIEL